MIRWAHATGNGLMTELKWKKWIGRILGMLLALGALAALYFTLIVAQPQSAGKTAAREQPQLTASPGMTVDREGDLRTLAQTYPGPFMSFMSGSGLSFVSGACGDAAWNGKTGRILTLLWQTGDGQTIRLQSIYPAEALDLMGKGDYTFSGTAGPTLFGRSSVRMENGNSVRVHVQAEGEGIFVMTVPRSLSGSLSALSRSIQLFTAE